MRVKQTVIVGALSLLLAAPALAGSCPVMVKDIDAALAAGPNISAAQVAEAKALRDKGEAQHQAGQHKESVESLKMAKAILGLM